MTLFEDAKDSWRFANRVGPGGEDDLQREVEVGATVEEVTVRIYRGAELDLRVTPYVAYNVDQGRAQKMPLVTFVDGGKSFIDGDGDRWTFPVSIPVEEGDVLGVEANNKDPNNGYDYAVDLSVDKAGGKERVAGLLTSVSEVLP